MVGTTGFEPATSRTPSVRATRLRYVPTASALRDAEPKNSKFNGITCLRAASTNCAKHRVNPEACLG
jgi:hypothetical protein